MRHRDSFSFGMNRAKWVLWIALMVVGMAACDKNEPPITEGEQVEEHKETHDPVNMPGDEPAPTVDNPPPDRDEHNHGEMDKAEGDTPSGELTMVEVPEGGKEFDPPIMPEQLPSGVWYCDMKTVEYARPEKGDGKCPVCGMMLKQKP